MATFNGNNNNNTITGSNDAGDLINAFGGNDLVNAADGNDTVYGGAGADTLNGQNGNDLLDGGAQNDALFGGADADTLIGAAGADTLNGGTGNDFLEGGADNDVIIGGDGIDTVVYEGEVAAVTVNLTTGTATGTGAGTDSISQVENAVGGRGNDSLTGNGGANLLDGNAGNDTLVAGAGNDTLIGGHGNDSVLGETGNDLMYGGGGADSLFGGDDNDTLSGGDGTDSLDGGQGADVILGGGGGDSISGGSGNDTLTGDTTTPAANLHLDWSAAGADEQDITGGITQDTGGILVTATYRNDGNGAGLSVESTTLQYVAGGEPFSTTSSAQVGGGNITGNTATILVDFEAVAGSGFSDSVSNVTFRINDVDAGAWDDLLRVRAYDAAGNLLQVSLSYQGVTQVSTNPLVNATGGWGYSDAGGSVLVSIPGPVAYLEIDWDQGGSAGQFIAITDIHFTAVPSTEGNDSISGGLGDDVISGGGGSDLLMGDDGNDEIDGDLGDDRLFGGDGADTLDGGDGNDSIEAGAGTDLVEGGNGNDTILFGAGDDSVYGGAGNDRIDDVSGGGENGFNYIDAGTGNDTVWAGMGNDTIFGGSDDDVLDGEEGNDQVSGDSGNDQVSGGLGLDTLSGGDGNDSLFGGGDGDSLDGGTGNDSLEGGTGNDTLDGGIGADQLFGGDDRDLFFGGPSDAVFGGNGGDDFDTLDLTAWGKANTTITFDPGNPENGTVEFFDAFGAPLGILTFTDIENVIPCFTPGTLITTPDGLRAVEDLQVGDLILTRDSGFQPIRWVGRRDLGLAELVVRPAMRPIRISRGALGNGLPCRDMLVSPQHRMLIEGAKAEILFDDSEVLVTAIHLLGQPGISQTLTPGISYIHFMFDRHEIVQADGAWTESFQPGTATLKGMCPAQRDEVTALFPELADSALSYPAARATLRAHEVRVLLAA